MSEKKSETDYSLKTEAGGEIEAPILPYAPPKPKSYDPPIGLIGCGGITQTHLKAYKALGLNVVALCDKTESNARRRQEEWYPDAQIYTDYRELLARDDIEVVDIATHPPERVAIIEAAIAAKKHILSQKPFVLDLDTGERLVHLAEQAGVKLAVNQNGRFAPHFSYIRQAIGAGLIGDVISSHMQVHWNHTWVKGTPFENIHDLILYDFAIHWFDMTAQIWKNRDCRSVFATKAKVRGQEMAPPMAAQVLLDYEGGQASLTFDAHVLYGAQDHSYVSGTQGTLVSNGPDLGTQQVTFYNETGVAHPVLEGNWFLEGFQGSMTELLCAIEEDRQPSNNARDNLKSLELCFAAIASTMEGKPKIPGEVRALPKGSVPEKMVGSR